MQASDGLQRLHERREFLVKRIGEESAKKTDKSTLLANYEKALSLIEGQIFDAEMTAINTPLRFDPAGVSAGADPIASGAAQPFSAPPPHQAPVVNQIQATRYTAALCPAPVPAMPPTMPYYSCKSSRANLHHEVLGAPLGPRGEISSSQSAILMALAQPSVSVPPSVPATPASHLPSVVRPPTTMAPPPGLGGIEMHGHQGGAGAATLLSPRHADSSSNGAEGPSRRSKRSRSPRDQLHTHDYGRNSNSGATADRDYGNNNSNNNNSARSTSDNLGLIRVATSGLQLHPCERIYRQGCRVGAKCCWAVFPRVACLNHILSS